MVHNVRAIDAILADGTAARFGETPGNFGNDPAMPERASDLVRRMRALHRREATRSMHVFRNFCARSAATTST